MQPTHSAENASQVFQSSRCSRLRHFGRVALMMGAGRVIAIDEVPERLAMAEAGGAETIDFSEVDVYDELMSRTAKRGPDSCTDAVGCEADAQARAKAMRPRTTCRRPSRRSTSQVWKEPRCC
jgi:hypothetical protein